MTDWIDKDLQLLADDVQFPPTPDLRARVLAGLAERHDDWRRPLFGRSLALALLMLLLLAATVAAAAFLLPGFRLSFVPTLPGESSSELGSALVLGEPVAADSVDMPLPASLAEPDEVYVAHDGEVLSAVYRADDGLPEIGDTGAGALLQVIRGTLDTDRVRKLVVERDVTVTAIEVGGSAGFWIEGEPHLVTYYSPSGDERTEMTRLVGDTLVWQHGQAVYRLESALGRTGAIRLAESIEE